MTLHSSNPSSSKNTQPDHRILPLSQRLPSAVRRRAVWHWQELSGQHRPPAIAAGLQWLHSVAKKGGVALHTGSPDSCPGVTASLIPTLGAFGQWQIAGGFAEWLMSIQVDSGAIPDACMRCPSLFNTAQALQGFLSLSDDHSEMLPAAYRAAEYLSNRIDGRGCILPERSNDDSSMGGTFDRWSDESVRLTILPALVASARRLHEPSWEAAAGRALQHASRRLDLAEWRGPSHWHGLAVDALIELNQCPEFECGELLAAAIQLPIALQRRDGSFPAAPNSRETSAAGQAIWAAILYKLGQRQRAERAMQYLRRRQTTSGGFPLSWPCGRIAPNSSEGTWAMKHFFESAQWQVRVSFEDERPDLPAEIDSTDGRWLAIRDWFAELGPRSTVADIGCGQGRFLSHLSAEFPSARLIGVDISQQMLSQLPASIEGRLGTMLNLPIDDGQLDAVFAVESLEHCLLPQRAISEMCRVVRPGGQILIIDKRRDRQPLSEHEPWEQWFTPEEVSHWLAGQCRDINSTPISHGNSSTDGLFLCWRATRREAVGRRLAA